jgi:hypothetical protein
MAFLERLTVGDANEEKFVVRGCHSVISACALPPWTPGPVVDLMIQAFGKILREDLITLKTNVDASGGFSRNRSDSTGSDTLSVDSVGSYKAVSQDVGGTFQAKMARHQLMHSAHSSTLPG